MSAIKIYKIEAEGDTIYFEAADENGAYEKICSTVGQMSRSILTFTEVERSDVPEGVDVL